MITEEKKKKNYIKGSARQRDFKGDNHLINVDLLLSDLQTKLPVNEAGYVKITLSKLKEPDRYGNTHSIYENDFVPQAQPNRVASEPAPANPSNLKKMSKDLDSLPF